MRTTTGEFEAQRAEVKLRSLGKSALNAARAAVRFLREGWRYIFRHPAVAMLFAVLVYGTLVLFGAVLSGGYVHDKTFHHGGRHLESDSAAACAPDAHRPGEGRASARLP